MEDKLKYQRIFMALAALLPFVAFAQVREADMERLSKIPLEYTIRQTTTPIQIDGVAEEEAWSQTDWMEGFTDIITGAIPSGDHTTRCKLLWDNSHVYVYAELKEPHIWATFDKHDDRIFQENAFEIFINPDGSTYHYFEIQINAKETVWDLYLPKPYRNGGRPLNSWNPGGIRKAVKVAGTLNNPADIDSCWTIEMAIPFQSMDIRPGGVMPGTIWRMNLSRVQWQLDVESGVYVKRKDDKGKPLPEQYIVWSPVGILNLHFPERWGYVQFADEATPQKFLVKEDEQLKLDLWKCFYLQQSYLQKYGRYATALKDLDRHYNPAVEMVAGKEQFTLTTLLPLADRYMVVDNSGEVVFKKKDERQAK